MDLTAHPPGGRTGRLCNRDQGADSDEDRIRQLQLEASLEIVNGPVWQAIRDEIWTYSSRTLAKLIRTERVWAEYRRLGGITATDLRYPPNGITADDAHDLAIDTVTAGLPVLRAYLIEGRWRPDGGASIKTWATNLMVLRLPAAWRKWRRQLDHERNGMAAVAAEPRPSTSPTPPSTRWSSSASSSPRRQPPTRDAARLRRPQRHRDRRRPRRLTAKQVEYRLRKGRDAVTRRVALEARIDRRRHAG